VHSPWEFLLVALLVTLTPGPATALVLRTAARDGRAAAMRSVVGNSIGILMWALLSAVGVSSLILASRVAYDVLRIGGAVVLAVLGLQALFARHRAEITDSLPRLRAGWRTGLITAVANPKLAVFFIALFPQFVGPHQAVLPAALAMAGVLVAIDAVYFSPTPWAVERVGALTRPRVRRAMERTTGTVMVGLAVSLAVDSH
jgi:threonine/homoserine/homoserine lactone efflux protein